MPFKSEKQRRYLHANEPELAKKWEGKYGSKIEKQKQTAKQMRSKTGSGTIGSAGATS